MKRFILAVVIAIALADATPARGQFVLGPVLPPAHGSRFGFSTGQAFLFQRPGVRVVGFAGGFYSRSVIVVPPVLPPITTLTPFGWAPGFLNPGWGVGPGWGWFPPPPVIVVPPPIILAGNNEVNVDPDANPNANLNPNANPALGFEQLPRPIDPLPRGAKPGDFVVISPKPNALPQLPPPVLAPGQVLPGVDRVAAVPRPQVPTFKFDPFAKRIAVNVDRPDPDPLKEAARLVKLGREAFAAGEYGKAAEQFDRATAADPKAALPHFLKSQAAFAAGRYAEAVLAIRAGLALDPAWPAGTFDPKEPYGVNPAAFANHLAELRKVVSANPGEATLEFLLGYQLWFTGEKVEAKKLFDAAEKRLLAPGPLALFK